jgi:hypothetical protein
MARSKSSSSKPRRQRILAAARPNVRPSVPSLVHEHQPPNLQRDEDAHTHLSASNPLRDQSTGSLPTSRSTTQTSSSSAKLDQQRQLSTILTPNSSEASRSEDGVSTTRATANLVGHGHRFVRRSLSTAAEQVLPTIDETLAGQGRWATVHIDAMQDVEFVNTGPDPEPTVTQGHSPWSGLHQNAEFRPGGNSPEGSDVNRGGRRGGLGRVKAAKVGGMRLTRACLRCFVYRIECDELEPCSQCRRRMRTWNLGCTRRRLPERLSVLLPDIITAKLEYAKVCVFINSSALYYRGERFHLPLTQFLGERELWIPVREVEPSGLELMRRQAFTISTDEAERIVQPVDLKDLPVIPCWPPERQEDEVTQINETLEAWLSAIALKERSGWQNHVFPRLDNDVYLWERHIMGQMCLLLDPSDPGHAKLEVAMELTFCNHLVIHSFAVPNEHLKYVFGKMHNAAFKDVEPDPEQELGARAVNKFLAMLIMRKIRLQAGAVLEHLSLLFADRKSTVELGVLTFCESFLFLLVLAQLQRSVLEHAISMRIAGDTSFSMQEAREEIQRMENELATVIIELCVFKLRKVSKRVKAEGRPLEAGGDVDMGAQDSSASRFFDRLHKITELCGKFARHLSEANVLMRFQVGAWTGRQDSEQLTSERSVRATSPGFCVDCTRQSRRFCLRRSTAT